MTMKESFAKLFREKVSHPKDREWKRDIDRGDALRFAPAADHSPHEYKAVKEFSDDLEGIVKPSTSPWSSALLPLREKEGTLRICVALYVRQMVLQRRNRCRRIDDQTEDSVHVSFRSLSVSYDAFWLMQRTCYLPNYGGRRPMSIHRPFCDWKS